MKKSYVVAATRHRVDLIKLYASCDHSQWNQYLTERLRLRDVSGLTEMRVALQVGMSDLAKKKLNTEKMILWFIRLQRSIEKTIQKIVREANPNPCDNPLIAAHHRYAKPEKKIRDHDLELFFKRYSY